MMDLSGEHSCSNCAFWDEEPWDEISAVCKKLKDGFRLYGLSCGKEFFITSREYLCITDFDFCCAFWELRKND